MGKIARAAATMTADAGAGGGWKPAGTAPAVALWDRAFRRQGRQQSSPQPQSGKPVADPSKMRGRSLISPNERAFVKLLEAMRSDAPGGWSDDRYEQTLRHFTGITYVAIHRLSTQMARAEFQVYREDPTAPDGKRPVSQNDPDGWELVQLLRKPNKQDSFGKLMYRWSQQKKLTGSALTWMEIGRAHV